MKRTPWYPASIRPVRFGWYEFRTPRLDTEFVPAFWTGYCWLEQVCGTERLIMLDTFEGDRWRGLAEKPKS